MSELQDVTTKRTLLQTRIVATQKIVNAFDEDVVTTTDLELAREELKEHLDKTNALNEETALLCSTKDEYAPHKKDFETLFAAIRTLTLRTMNFQTLKRVAVPQAAPAFKLEKIKLPQFNGDFADWRSFHDLFEDHLKSCLTGEASKIVSAFQATAANYIEAWDTVKKRYDNPREIIFAHLSKFDQSKNMLVENGPGLRTLADTINECVRSLKVLEVPVDSWDLILIYYAMKKLDPETKKQWSLVRKTALPTLEDFLGFLESRSLALTDPSILKQKTQSSTGDKRATTSHHVGNEPAKCNKCCGQHYLRSCEEFLGLPIKERRSFASSQGLCFVCLTKGHMAKECPRKWTCQKCGQRHHNLLHIVSKSTPTSSTSHAAKDEDTTTPSPTLVPFVGTSQSNSTQHKSIGYVLLLGTLIVTTDDSNGEKQDCRVFVDSGSEPNFIFEGCVTRLGLKRKATCVVISGVGDAQPQTAKGIVKLRLHSRVRDYSTLISCLVLPKVAGPMPRFQCQSSWSHLKDIELGDPNYHKPGAVDILLGCEAAAVMKMSGLINGPQGAPVAQETQFGWLLTGLVGQPYPTKSYHTSSFHSSCHEDKECLEDSLQKFWILEEPSHHEIPSTEEEKMCNEHFVSTYKRDVNGVFTVQLPFREGASPLGHSRQQAVKRFHRVETRFLLQPELKIMYAKIIEESTVSGFMEKVPEEEKNTQPSDSCYMPHREVVKSSSSTTKVRIVFDASAKTSSGQSLNDVLLTGPKLQPDLVPLLIRFRSHLIVISADITKFYHQFKVSNRDKDFQRFVWRDSLQHPLQDYRMTRVTFGVTCAPFLAIRCLNQLAEDEKDSFPLAATSIKEDFLVDNWLAGAKNVDEALILQDQVCQVLKKGNLQLRSWSSNSELVLKSVPEDLRDFSSSLTIDDTEVIRTIGLLWHPNSDTFGVSIVVPDLTLGSSKRKVLSSIARIFDPLGWLSPVTVRPKILMQELWKAKLDWDTPLPPHLHKKWVLYCQELPTLKSLSIDRCILQPYSSSPAYRYELHGFSDASQAAYAACIYIRTIDEEAISHVNLVIAKTKVAPIKKETIPRLELCGALLLTKLMQTVRGSLKMEFSVVRCWTDSTIVLDWLSRTNKQPVFVANRVYSIESNYPRSYWHHVDGVDNPADSASRGISATALVNHKLWLHGPAWLAITHFPPDAQAMVMTEKMQGPIDQFISKCSSFSKMKRIVAFCIRFIWNSKRHRNERRTGGLGVMELKQSLNRIVSCVQAEVFPEELRRIRHQEMVKSPIKFLTPFLDKNGILRVGGRLQHAPIPFEKKHPILLPKVHNLTNQVVRFFHLNHLHAAPQLLLSVIRDQFWVLGGQEVTKRIVRSCVICHRQNPTTQVQLMGQLPLARVTPSRPFSRCGMDYAGPFMLCSRGGRNPLILKYYIAVFVCMATRAVHLETVSDLTTAGFIGALHRFISRRGLPADVYSDGGTNFVGAKNEVEQFQRFVQSNPHKEKIESFLSDKGIRFHFNPPLSPHHGGLWEAAVKSMKLHLRKVIGDRHFSVEEFCTLLCQVEACLNSRPLSPISTDPNDFTILTPGHFLVGDSLTALPRHDLTDLKIGRLTRWEATQQTFQNFWKRWSTEYLNQLQNCPKWLAAEPNIKIGTLVLVKDDSVLWGPLKWKLARISAVFPGKDGKVRVVEVTTPNGSIYRRPIIKISPLPIYQ